MLAIADIGLEQEKVMTLFDGVYSTVVIRDILEREKRRNQKRITDPFLLRKIILYLADNIGSNISLSNVTNILVNEGLLEENNSKKKLSTHTIQAYVGALLESYFFYEIKRFDIKGKEYLKTLGKYYIVDIGLRNYLLGFRDSEHIIENIVYFELLRRGYDVAIEKIDNAEIDFIATNYKDKIYIQFTESMMSEEVRKRELTPLIKINDNYEKMILCLDEEGNSFNISVDKFFKNLFPHILCLLIIFPIFQYRINISLLAFKIALCCALLICSLILSTTVT